MLKGVLAGIALFVAFNVAMFALSYYAESSAVGIRARGRMRRSLDWYPPVRFMQPRCCGSNETSAISTLRNISSSEEQFRDTVQSINDPATHSMLRAEWAFLEELNVDAAAPIAVLAGIEGKAHELEGMVCFPDGSERIQCMVKGSIGDEEDVGRTLATEILESGGREVIAEFRLS